MAVPMIGFGFMDNLVMIQAGEAIDSTIGVAFGLATMTSAAFGQIVSDVSGTLSGGAVEALASSLGLPQSGLTQEQLRLRNVKVIGTLGAALGVGCGCLMGMSCLLFMDLDKADRLKKKAELRTLYATLMEEGHKLIGAEHCALFLLDAPYDPKQGASDLHLTSMGWKGKEPTKDELDEAFREMDEDKSGTVSALELYHALRMNGWTADLDDVERMIRGSAGEEQASKRGLRREEFGEVMRSVLASDEVRLRVRENGSRQKVIMSGEMLNVRNVRTDARIDDESRRRYLLRGYEVLSLLLAPVFDSDGRVIGLVELVNKEDRTRAPGNGLRRFNSVHGFTEDDERLLRMLCTHCSIYLRHLDTGD